jgi:8-oxo-dGTP diphosphatase
LYSQILQSLNNDIENLYGNRLRIRVCGILAENNKLLVVEHKNMGTNGFFISPPGGGLNIGEKIEDCLMREFLEETGLEISIGNFLFANEYLDMPLHAIELFFEVKKIKGELRLGNDPEMEAEKQILNKIYFSSYPEILAKGEGNIHQIFKHFSSLEEILNTKSEILKNDTIKFTR